jgi:hypothetical protein
LINLGDASSIRRSISAACVGEKGMCQNLKREEFLNRVLFFLVNIAMVLASLLAATLQSAATDLTKYFFPNNSWQSWLVHGVLLVLVGLASSFLVNHMYSKQRQNSTRV